MHHITTSIESEDLEDIVEAIKAFEQAGFISSKIKQNKQTLMYEAKLTHFDKSYTVPPDKEKIDNFLLDKWLM